MHEHGIDIETYLSSNGATFPSIVVIRALHDIQLLKLLLEMGVRTMVSVDCTLLSEDGLKKAGRGPPPGGGRRWAAERGDWSSR